MSEGLHRRTLIVVSGAALLTGCSRLMYDVLFEADSAAIGGLLNAIDAFAAGYGYHPVKVGREPPKQLYLEYVSSQARIIVSKIEHDDRFEASFMYRDEVWFVSGDLSDVVRAFTETIRPLNGVRVEGAS